MFSHTDGWVGPNRGLAAGRTVCILDVWFWTNLNYGWWDATVTLLYCSVPCGKSSGVLQDQSECKNLTETIRGTPGGEKMLRLSFRDRGESDR